MSARIKAGRAYVSSVVALFGVKLVCHVVLPLNKCLTIHPLFTRITLCMQAYHEDHLRKIFFVGGLFFLLSGVRYPLNGQFNVCKHYCSRCEHNRFVTRCK